MEIAKIFQLGNNQAIQLPKGYRINSDTVKLTRIGSLIVLVPIDDPYCVLPNISDGS